MTARLLLGLVPADAVRPAICSDHGRLAVDPWQAITIAVDPADAGREEGLVTWATRQNEILSAYAFRGDVLPFPLGAVFSSDRKAKDHVRHGAVDLARAYRRLAGHCEFSLHVRSDGTQDESVSETGGGASYLRARGRARDCRRQRATARTAALESILAALGDIAADVRRFSTRDRDGLLRAAILLHRERVKPMLAALNRSAANAGRLGLHCQLIGPCPPYSFLEDDNARG